MPETPPPPRPLSGSATLHRRPPLSPAGLLLRRWWFVPLAFGCFWSLALLAAFDDGRLLRGVDESVTRELIEWRSPALDDAVRVVSQLGGITVVAAVLGVLALLVWHECRALAIALLLASATRPPLEWALKELVDRSRPDIDRMVPGTGPSFPSGHVMAAIAVWGLLPPVVGLLTQRRTAWWCSVGISGAVIISVAFSRVYLGVHWLTDVLGALVLGMLYLAAVEVLFEWHHRRRPCARSGANRSPPP